MQRVAALYDIHGNLPALEAVMAEVRAADVDALVVGGDVIPGPMPRECLDLLRDTGIPTRFIHGNGESAALEARSGGALAKVPEAFREGIRWSASQLPDEWVAQIAEWPPTTQLEVDGLGEVLFCHATPHNDTEIFTRSSPVDRLRKIFAGVEADVVICGHTHMQFDLVVDALRIVNAGSVGLPFAPAGAYWLLSGPHLELRHTLYDPHVAATRIRLTDFPGADAFASLVLNPRSEEEMLASYAAADGRIR